MKRWIVFTLLISSCIVVACSKENEESLRNNGGTTPTCDTANMRYSANVVPILTTNCYGCHGNGATMGGVKVDDYNSVRALATGGALLGVITHASGYSPMPKNGAQLSTCDINKVRAWINRGALNN